MGSMLINNIKIIAKLCQPVGVKDLSYQADMFPGFRRKKLFLK